jgi:hypothetical protein
MEVLVGHPAQLGAVVHCVDEHVADLFGRPDGDEQAVHGALLAAAREPVTKGAPFAETDEESFCLERFSADEQGRSCPAPFQRNGGK